MAEAIVFTGWQGVALVTSLLFGFAALIWAENGVPLVKIGK